MTEVPRPCFLWRPGRIGIIGYQSIEGAQQALRLWATEPSTSRADIEAAVTDPCNANLLTQRELDALTALADAKPATPEPRPGSHEDAAGVHPGRRMRAG
jgi:hypothetical protein